MGSFPRFLRHLRAGRFLAGVSSKMDEQQSEAAKQFDQRMFAWVNHHQLPLQKATPAVIDLISELFGGLTCGANKRIWNPEKPRKEFRILLDGTARSGKERIPAEDENEFDLGIDGKEKKWNSRNRECWRAFHREGSDFEWKQRGNLDDRRVFAARSGQARAETAVRAASMEVLWVWNCVGWSSMEFGEE